MGLVSKLSVKITSLELFMKLHLTAAGCHLSYEITQCYLSPNTSEHTPPSPEPDMLVLDLPTPGGWKAVS